MPEPQGTRLESDEEIKQVLQARRARLAAQSQKAPPGGRAKAPVAPPAEAEARSERPVLRPPVAMLCICDDGKLDGEWVRLRADTTVIGRQEGDIRIPHDGLLSGQHAQIVRQRTATGYRWVLVDMQSTNGTFVRIGSTALRNDNEVLVGGGRYRFEAGTATAATTPPAGIPLQSTQAWADASVRVLVPSLVELSPAGPLSRVALTLAEYWIGRDPKTCAIARRDDALVNARHARLYRDAKGTWHIENNKSLNGLWLRLAEPIPLASSCQFRLGEQRFLLQVK